jgi:Tol biopolymer transport system component
MSVRSASRLTRSLVALLLLGLGLGTSSPAGATFPGDNGKIVFVGTAKGNLADLLKVPPRGGSIVPLTDTPNSDGEPAISPSGRRVAFASSEGMGQSQIFVMRINGEGGRRITRGRNAEEPSWTPNGEAIVFARNTNDGGYELFKVRIGSEPRRGHRLTDSPGFEFESDVSSDGWIAFTYSLSKGQSEIVKMRLDGTRRRRITDTPNRIEQNPSWGPGANRIAISTNRPTTKETPDIAFIRADGSDRTTIMDRPNLGFINPAWSPNGEWIAATAFSESFDTKIVRFRSDGSPLDNVTTFAEGGRQPAWQPLP